MRPPPAGMSEPDEAAVAGNAGGHLLLDPVRGGGNGADGGAGVSEHVVEVQRVAQGPVLTREVWTRTNSPARPELSGRRNRPGR